MNKKLIRKLLKNSDPQLQQVGLALAETYWPENATVEDVESVMAVARARLSDPSYLLSQAVQVLRLACEFSPDTARKAEVIPVLIEAMKKGSPLVVQRGQKALASLGQDDLCPVAIEMDPVDSDLCAELWRIEQDGGNKDTAQDFEYIKQGLFHPNGYVAGVASDAVRANGGLFIKPILDLVGLGTEAEGSAGAENVCFASINRAMKKPRKPIPGYVDPQSSGQDLCRKIKFSLYSYRDWSTFHWLGAVLQIKDKQVLSLLSLTLENLFNREYSTPDVAQNPDIFKGIVSLAFIVSHENSDRAGRKILYDYAGKKNVGAVAAMLRDLHPSAPLPGRHRGR